MSAMNFFYYRVNSNQSIHYWKFTVNFLDCLTMKYQLLKTNGWTYVACQLFFSFDKILNNIHLLLCINALCMYYVIICIMDTFFWFFFFREITNICLGNYTSIHIYRAQVFSQNTNTFN